MYDKRILTDEELNRLHELKMVLFNEDCEKERNAKLKEVEQLFNKAKQRYKFMLTLNEEK